jgi:hypothetical protein
MGRKGISIITVQISIGNGTEIRESRKEDCTKMFFRLSVEFLTGIISTRHPMQVTGGMGL